MLKRYIESGHDILIEEHVVDALSYEGGIAGTTDVLLDGSKFPKTCLHKKFKYGSIGCRATHKFQWASTEAPILAFSGNCDVVDKVVLKKLQRRIRQAACVPTLKEFRLNKTLLFVKPTASSDPFRLASQSSKATALEKALQYSGVSSQPTSMIQISLESTASLVFFNWAKSPGNVGGTIPLDCAQEMKELFDIEKNDKKKCISTEVTLFIIKKSLLLDNWDVQVCFTVLEIRAFFSLNTMKMEQTIATLEIDSDDIKELENAIIAEEMEDETLSIKDLENEKSETQLCNYMSNFEKKKTWNGFTCRLFSSRLILTL